MRRDGAAPPLGLLVVLALLLSTITSASVAAADNLVDLPGSTPEFAPRLRPTPSAPSRPAAVELSVVLRPRNEADLEARAAGAGRGSQPLSHDDLISRYAPTRATFDQVKAYLQARGLTINYESDDRLVIGASADRATAEAAFATTSTYAELGGQAGFVNTAPLRVAASLAPAIASVTGFNELSAKQTFNQSRRVGPEAPPSGGPDKHWPSSLRKAYNVDAAGLDGQGATVGTTLWCAPTSSYKQWASDFGLPTPKVTVISVGNSGCASPAIQQEADLVVENIAAVAPKAAIRFYAASASTDAALMAATSRAINDQVDVISASWGACETNVAPADLQGWHTLFLSAAAQGMTLLAASGDSGIYACGTGSGQIGKATHPASDDLVNAIGGTSPRLDPKTFAWADETAWSCTEGSPPSCLHADERGASGGGSSTVFGAPSYQRATGAKQRQSPDYSANADPDSGMWVRLAGSSFVGGGTSASAAWLAGAVALAVQRQGGPVGEPHAVLYAAPTGKSGLFDVTNGYNGERAGPGYDRVTGLGSVKDVAAFVDAITPRDHLPKGAVYRPNGLFPSPDGEADGGSSLYDQDGQGEGGQNDQPDGGPAVRPGRDSSPVPFQVRNDGTVADSYRLTFDAADGETLPAGLKLSFGDLASGAATGKIAPDDVQSRDVTISAPRNAAPGSYRAIIRIASQTDPSKSDSVTLWFRIVVR